MQLYLSWELYTSRKGVVYICQSIFLVCCLPLLGGEAESFPSGLHDFSSLGFILWALSAQETTQLVLLLGKNCIVEMVNVVLVIISKILIQIVTVYHQMS